MKIAIFSDYFYPELGGIQDSIIALSKELGRMGHRVDFYVPKSSARDFKVSGFPEKEIELGENVHVHRLFSFSYPSPTAQSRIFIPSGLVARLLKDSKPDVIHTNTFLGLGLEAILDAKLLKIPIVRTNHLPVTDYSYLIPLNQKMVKKYSLKYVCWYYNQCNFVTGPSESVFTDMNQSGFKTPYRAISNPIDIRTFTPIDPSVSKSSLKSKWNLSPHTIVFAGRITSEKKIDVLIRAVADIKKSIPDIVLAVAGHGDKEADFKSLAVQLGVSDNVRFVGTLKREDLVDLYRASEIFTIASVCETQGLVMMQAMACALPIVGVSARALPEYINDKNGVMVEPEDHAAIAEKVISLLGDEARMSLLGQGGFEYVKQFAPEIIAQEWINIYNKTIALKRGLTSYT